MHHKIAAIKAKNSEIFYETISLIDKGFYTTPSGKEIPLPIDQMLAGNECFHQELPPIDFPPVEGGTTVLVEKGDCLVVAERLVNESYNPALLNFASSGHPGGGVKNGSQAQEETICRRSTLARSIFTFDQKYAEEFGFEHNQGNNYPLSNLDFSVIYSPAVTVFRNGPDCTFMETPYQIAIITNSALNLNGKYSLRLTHDGHMPPKVKEITLNKIRTIFRLGLLKGHDSLVLGAFGCGAFKNPPSEMAMLFKQVIEEPEFKDRYRLITFAIIADHNDRNNNFASFSEVFNQ